MDTIQDKGNDGITQAVSEDSYPPVVFARQSVGKNAFLEV